MLTHVDQKNNPTMVDVTGKDISARYAKAHTLVQLPEAFRTLRNGDELTLKKGPVFQTAIIAGTMAVKRTHEMIPFCHQIPVESCKFQITMSEDLLVTIECEVKTTFKTGVEMEALHGATVAALTVYDMCKAVSHEMEIRETKLISKTGGKRTILERPTYGLVLTGGKSERMESAKALLDYRGKPHAQYIYEILEKYCKEVFLSARIDQWKGTTLENFPTITDSVNARGPIAGILSAFEKHPDANWIVVACDLAYFGDNVVSELLHHFDSNTVATAFKNVEKGFPEPLCALYTPKAKKVFEAAVKNDITCPVKVLRNTQVTMLDQGGSVNLANINTKEEYKEVIHDVR